MVERVEAQLRSAGMADEADALALEMPLLDQAVYSTDPANRKRMHFESHRRRRACAARHPRMSSIHAVLEAAANRPELRRFAAFGSG